MISLLKFEYEGALHYISANLEDQGFTKIELKEIQKSAQRIAQKAEKLSKKKEKK